MQAPRYPHDYLIRHAKGAKVSPTVLRIPTEDGFLTPDTLTITDKGQQRLDEIGGVK